MILYFADRHMNIIGMASTSLPDGLTISDDNKTSDVESGVAVFECSLPYNSATRAKVEECAAVGNYLLRDDKGKTELYTIIESEADTKSREVRIYAEDGGLDLLNEICEAYEADKAYPIAHYVEMYAYDSGFTISTNEISERTRKLSWDGESTRAERIASVATQFDAEIDFSFVVEGMRVKSKHINIYKERGNYTGVQLRLNREVDRIVTKKTIANVATALMVTGGTPEDAEKPITLHGYTYDDGDIYLEGTIIKSRSALDRWTRYHAEGGDYTGHILRIYRYDTTDQKELCTRAVEHLKTIANEEVNYEADLRLPDNVKVGDRINIIDDEGELYLSTRILALEESVTRDSTVATLGEFLIKDSGINKQVADLAAEFAKNASSALRALEAAKAAQAEAENAKQTAATADQKADNAIDEAAQAMADAAAAQAQMAIVQERSELAITNANAAQQSAATATSTATDAQTIAAAAKIDAEKAKEDILALGDQLTTVSHTMEADYTRKTDLTATEASLQSQISQNAAQIASTVSSVTKIDETVNGAAAQAAAAQKAADDAQNAADKAQSDLEAAEAALAAVQGKADATATDLAAAQAAVKTAQDAADKAKADAAAAQTAVNNLATRVTNAETAITQNSNAINLRATKSEVANTLAGYSTTEQMNAAINVSANAVKTTVSQTYATNASVSQNYASKTELSTTASGLSAEISNSAKTATSYMSYDSTNGLQIGNRTSGNWSGYRAQVKNDSFNVLNASGAVVAKYGTNEVQLGNLSNDSVIRFCQDGKIYHDASDGTGRTTIESNAIQLLGNNASYPNSTAQIYAEPYRDGAYISLRALSATNLSALDVYAGGINLTGSTVKINGKTIVDTIYPVGSIYLAYNHTSPASLFGGTWARIESRFLYATAGTGVIGEEGVMTTGSGTVKFVKISAWRREG